MAIDLDLLMQRRRYVDPASGITEEFIQPEFGGAPTVAIVSRPLDGSCSAGFVLCHSFGMEQTHLSRFDSVMARALAGAGFTVLRFHAPGYGDSHVTVERTTLSRHLAATTDAVRWLSELDGVEQVGTMGARVGGLVAALVADREGLPLLAVWDPVVAGRQYMRDFLRSQLLHKLVLEAAGERGSLEQTEKEEPGLGIDELRRQLEDGGWAEVKGFPLSGTTYREFSAVNLSKDLARFSGNALIVAVGHRDRMGGAAAKLKERLESLGARCWAEVVYDRAAGLLGQHHHANVPGGTKVDTQFSLTRSVADLTVRWASRQLGGGASSRGSAEGLAP